MALVIPFLCFAPISSCFFLLSFGFFHGCMYTYQYIPLFVCLVETLSKAFPFFLFFYTRAWVSKKQKKQKKNRGCQSSLLAFKTIHTQELGIDTFSRGLYEFLKTFCWLGYVD